MHKIKELESMLMRLSPREIGDLIDECGAWGYLPPGGLSGATYEEMATALIDAGYDPADGIVVNGEYERNSPMERHSMTGKHIKIDMNAGEMVSLMVGASKAKRSITGSDRKYLVGFEHEIRELLLDMAGAIHENPRVRIMMTIPEAQSLATSLEKVLPVSGKIDKEDIETFIGIVDEATEGIGA